MKEEDGFNLITFNFSQTSYWCAQDLSYFSLISLKNRKRKQLLISKLFLLGYICFTPTRTFYYFTTSTLTSTPSPPPTASHSLQHNLRIEELTTQLGIESVTELDALRHLGYARGRELSVAQPQPHYVAEATRFRPRRPGMIASVHETDQQ